MYLTSLVVRRDPACAAASGPDEVEQRLHAALVTPPPEHTRFRHDDDAVTVTCFVAAGTEHGADAQMQGLRARVAEAISSLTGWSLEPEPRPGG